MNSAWAKETPEKHSPGVNRSRGNQPAPMQHLEPVLAAWYEATVKLERTHRLLQAEVRRLSEELAAKNRQLQRKTRLEDLGRVASHVAHEVRNSLVPLTLYVSLLRRHTAGNAACEELLDKMQGALTGLDAMVQDLLHFAADRQPQCQSVQVAPVVRQLCEDLAPQLQAQGIDLVLDVPEPTTVWADPDMFRRAVLNLLFNALDVMRQGGTLSITAVETPQGLELEVADSGPGLSDEARRRAFEPFFSTKNNGTGLGLAIVSHILEQHQGSVLACNCPEGGAAFTLRFPPAPKSEPLQLAPAA